MIPVSRWRSDDDTFQWGDNKHSANCGSEIIAMQQMKQQCSDEYISPRLLQALTMSFRLFCMWSDFKNFSRSLIWRSKSSMRLASWAPSESNRPRSKVSPANKNILRWLVSAEKNRRITYTGKFISFSKLKCKAKESSIDIDFAARFTDSSKYCSDNWGSTRWFLLH
jgi:hypothetical protein